MMVNWGVMFYKITSVMFLSFVVIESQLLKYLFFTTSVTSYYMILYVLVSSLSLKILLL